MLEEIHELEMNETYPDAIDALEEALRQADPTCESEIVVRLGFNLWYVVVEEGRLRTLGLVDLPVAHYAQRFVQLLDEYGNTLSDNADFNWAFGTGISLFYYHFPTCTEQQGNRMREKARKLDSFYKRFGTEESEYSDMEARFRGRGIFEAYYL